MRTLILAVAWKGTVLVAAAWAASLALRRASAATRHLLWCAALAALVLLPALLAVVPWWTVPAPRPLVAPAILVAPATTTVTSSAVAPPARGDWLLPLWLTGAMVVAGWFLAGAVRLAAIKRRARRLADPEVPVDLRETGQIAVPLVWGLWRPVILLPAGAAEWDLEHRRMVLLHELGHVARRDCWTQALAQLACVLYWFHPLVWLAAARLRREREQACDDRVLGAGVKASDYAGHLLELARSLRPLEPAPGAVAMAQRSGFEGRLLAILDQDRRRGDLSRRTAAALAVAALALLVPLAALRAAPALGSVAGTVYDVSGGVFPGAEVVLLPANDQNLYINGVRLASGEVLLAGGGQNLAVRTGQDGEFRFPSVAPGRYQLTVAGRGFRHHLQTVVVPDSGRPVRMDIVLQPGEVRESIEVRAAGRPAPATLPRRIRVGGNVQHPKLLSGHPPAYPESARANGVEGVVLIRTAILTDGSTAEPMVLNSPDPELAKAALDAVRQWRYQPTLLNGAPVEAVTTITVSFRLDE